MKNTQTKTHRQKYLRHQPVLIHRGMWAGYFCLAKMICFSTDCREQVACKDGRSAFDLADEGLFVAQWKAECVLYGKSALSARPQFLVDQVHHLSQPAHFAAIQ